MFDLLKAAKLHPIEWSEAVARTGVASPFIGEVLDRAFEHASAVVVIMSPDDMAYLKPEFRSKHEPIYEVELTGQPRPNVLFEAGMAMGRNAHRTILVEFDRVRPFSDIAGRHILRFDGSITARKELLLRLQSAGCPIDLGDRRWRKAGKFGDLVGDGAKRKSDKDSEPSVQLRARVIRHLRNRIRIEVSNDGRSSIENLEVVSIDCENLVLLDQNESKTLLVPGSSTSFSAVALTDDALDSPMILQLTGGIPSETEPFSISVPVSIH